MGSLDIPILFLSGSKDALVPPSHVKQLHKIAKRGKIVHFKDGDHNTTIMQPGYFEALEDFLRLLK